MKCKGEWKNIITISLCKDFAAESLKRGRTKFITRVKVYAHVKTLLSHFQNDQILNVRKTNIFSEGWQKLFVFNTNSLWQTG